MPKILESIPEQNRNPNIKIKVLWVLWDSESNKLMFWIKFNDNEDKSKKENQDTKSEVSDTKRYCLEDSATNPLGLLLPFVMKTNFYSRKFGCQKKKKQISRKNDWTQNSLKISNRNGMAWKQKSQCWTPFQFRDVFSQWNRRNQWNFQFLHLVMHQTRHKLHVSIS